MKATTTLTSLELPRTPAEAAALARTLNAQSRATRGNQTSQRPPRTAQNVQGLDQPLTKGEADEIVKQMNQDAADRQQAKDAARKEQLREIDELTQQATASPKSATAHAAFSPSAFWRDRREREYATRGGC